MVWLECEWAHFWRYRQSVSTTELVRIDTTNLVATMPATMRGTIVHALISQWKRGWTDAEGLAAASHLIVQAVPMPDVQAEYHAHTFVAAAKRFLTSALGQRMDAAVVAGRRVLREIPFSVQVGEAREAGGSIDLVFEEADGWVLVDLKDAMAFGVKDQQAALEGIAERYRPQLGLYALALSQAMPGARLKEVALFFTAIDIPGGAMVAEPVTGAFLSHWRSTILASTDAMVAGTMPASPVYAAHRCDRCPLARLCRPAGMPDEILTQHIERAAARAA
jgi:hypothetical protein